MGHSIYDPGQDCRSAWNAGRKLGAKRPLHPKQVWAVRFWLDQEHRLRDRALFDLAIDSKLRGCDLVKVRIGELVSGARIRQRAIVIQQKTGRPVQFELLDPQERAYLSGSSAEAVRWMTTSSRAGQIILITSARASMPSR